MLGKTHLYLGIAIVIIFLLTGQYMHRNFNHLHDMELMSRALFRAGHLYILLFGLINMSLGAYYQQATSNFRKRMQWLGSAIIFFASFLVIFAFFKELPAQQIERPITRYSLYLILAGVSVHGLVSIRDKKSA